MNEETWPYEIFNYPVKKGTNILKIRSTDKAGNKKEDSLTVIVSGT